MRPPPKYYYEEIYLPGQNTPISSEPDRTGHCLLRRVRDEAHRFAIDFHRQKRGARMTRSRLSEIPGIGPKRIKELLLHFQSVDAIRLATVEEISTVAGIGSEAAKNIRNYFHPEESI